MSAHPLFDFAEAVKQEAIASCEASSREFVEEAYDVLLEVARRLRRFSSLDVWEEYQRDPLRPAPNHPRAIGPVLARAQKAGIVTATNQFVKSGRTSDHNQSLRIWESRL